MTQNVHSSEEDSDREVRVPNAMKNHATKRGVHDVADVVVALRKTRTRALAARGRNEEPTDRVRGSDPSYRRKEEPADFDDEDDGDEPATSHRNLPTWEDALHAIVESNIENGDRSPQQHFGNRGRGSRDRGGDRGGMAIEVVIGVVKEAAAIVGATGEALIAAANEAVVIEIGAVTEGVIGVAPAAAIVAVSEHLNVLPSEIAKEAVNEVAAEQPRS